MIERMIVGGRKNEANIKTDTDSEKKNEANIKTDTDSEKKTRRI